MWTLTEVRDFFEVKRGVRLQAQVKGPSDSTLLFYPWGRHRLVIQVWPHQGSDVFCNNLSPKTGATVEWLDSLLRVK